jgi:dTDP-4-dehydrorhamnose reductase
MKILLTGASGQVGYELARSLQSYGEVIALDRRSMDLADLDQVRDVIRAMKPALIVNPAAYTAVDKAEQEPELAMRINGEAPGVMAQESARLGAAMIQYSTDYVFDGSKSGAYTEDDATNPLSVYGRSKLAGEQAVQAAGIAHLILRTSWVYGTRGKNFMLTIQRLAQERDHLRIVADQHGAPTWCRTLADTTANIIGQLGNPTSARQAWQQASGIYHLTAQGQTTWHGFAQAIVAALPETKKPQITPIASNDYPLPAARPQNSVLSSQRLINRFCRLPHWQAALALSLE